MQKMKPIIKHIRKNIRFVIGRFNNPFGLIIH